MTMTRLLSAKRLRRVAPEQYHALATEQKQLDILLNARIQARTIASAEGRRLAKENSPASTVPLHLIRRASPSNRSILELTCIKLETPLETRKDRDREQASSEAEAGFRVALADDDDAETQLRRSRIYELNKFMAARSNALWIAYRKRRMQQMLHLDRCIDTMAVMKMRWALSHFADRCDALRRDQERDEARREAEARAIAFARTLCKAANLPGDESMLKAMPLDPDSENASKRFCPWAATVEGCPLMESAGNCPLSHNPIPAAHATWAFRCWAQQKHGGWVNQRAKIG